MWDESMEEGRGMTKGMTELLMAEFVIAAVAILTGGMLDSGSGTRAAPSFSRRA